jgi:pimeloyl-ACP methyl ester carboxylesterase
MKTRSLFAILVLTLACAVRGEELEITPYEFKASDGTVVAAERGTFTVPENRGVALSRSLKLSFVRFAATGAQKGPPIVYLAGGPGGSGVDAAKGRRFPLFMAMREFGDVIAFDQRGTGASNDVPGCKPQNGFPVDRLLTSESAGAFYRGLAQECVAFWTSKGVDIAGYNTVENAADIDELRRRLGSEKVVLWGISYGTHLALAFFKQFPDRVERAVLSSIEGLDETVKVPAETDAFIARLQKAINLDPAAAQAYPDLAGMIRRVEKRLEDKPVKVPVKVAEGKEIELTLGKFDMQMLLTSSITDPRVSATLPGLFAMLDKGDFSQAAPGLYHYFRDPNMVTFGATSLAMDIASGLSPRMSRLVAKQARTSLVGDALNFPMPQLAHLPGIPDLGEDFRSPAKSNVPVLFMSGTLDGRTYPESAARIAAGFPNATRLIVENGGHNLFEAAPEIQDFIVAYMRTGKLPAPTISLPPPRFPH